MPLQNFGFVDSHKSGGKLWRSAQPDTAGMGTLNEIGIQNVIRLNGDGPSIEVEQASFQRGVVEPWYIGTLFASPSDTKTIAYHVRNLVVAGQSVLVHCAHGRDRTGLIIGAYRILFNGWTFDQVQAERSLYGVGVLEELPDLEIVQVLKTIGGNR
jgi:tyrosine-protein phosphatase SIW14